MSKCAVVILNWNGEKMLKEYLPSVVKYASDYDIIVADNGSTDNSLEFLHESFPQIRTITLDRNYGFAEGYNLALKEVSADYYFILNSDVELKSDPIAPLIDIIETDSNIGAVMPKILSQREPTKFEHAGAAGGFIDKYGFPFCRGRILKETESDNGQYDRVCEVFWATGAALFVRSELFHAMGGFDSDFFAHFEEIDFCYRLQNSGYRILCEPRSVVYHLGGGALSNESPFKLYLNYRNNLYMLHKNLPDGIYKKVIFTRMVIDGLLATIYLLTGKIDYFRSVVKAHSDYRKQRKALDKKRENITQKLNNSGFYNGSIILAYIRGQRKFSQLKNKYINFNYVER